MLHQSMTLRTMFGPGPKKRKGPNKKKKTSAFTGVKRRSRNPAFTGIKRYSMQPTTYRARRPAYRPRPYKPVYDTRPIIMAPPYPGYYPPGGYYPPSPQIHYHAGGRRSVAPAAHLPGALSAAGSAYIGGVGGHRFTGSLAQDIRRNRLLGY